MLGVTTHGLQTEICGLESTFNLKTTWVIKLNWEFSLGTVNINLILSQKLSFSN